MLRESQLFTLLDKALKQTAYIRKGIEAVYFCPFCSHYKKKLEVNVETEEWHCWICNSAGRSVWSLFKKLRVSDQLFDELSKVSPRPYRTPIEDKEEYRALPDGFVPLSKPSNTDEYGHAMSYLEDRNVSMDEIIRYNIGYCATGLYGRRVVVPSYDKESNVNFFAARTYYEDSSYKYILPTWSKDVVGFELFVNWNEPITLTEGTFDAMAIRRNAIPLFGTHLMLAIKLAVIQNHVKRINIVLDNDALVKAVNMYQRIEDLQVGDIDIHLIKLEDKDPSVLGYERINDIIESSKPYGFMDLLKTKLNLKK